MIRSFFHTLAFFALLFSGLLSQAMAAPGCTDDPRLGAINDLIAQIDAGPVDPVVVTPATYIAMPADLRARLGTHLEIWDRDCKPIQLYNGHPTSKITLPFPDLFQALYGAAQSSDAASVRAIADGFVAAPVSSFDFTRFFTIVRAPEGVSKTIAEGLGLTRSAPKTDWSQISCSKIEGNYILLSDIFARLGGTVSDPDGPKFVAVSQDGYTYLTLPDTTQYAFNRQPFEDNNCDIPKSYFLKSAALAGLPAAVIDEAWQISNIETWSKNWKEHVAKVEKANGKVSADDVDFLK